MRDDDDDDDGDDGDDDDDGDGDDRAEGCKAEDLKSAHVRMCPRTILRLTSSRCSGSTCNNISATRNSVLYTWQHGNTKNSESLKIGCPDSAQT